LEFGVYAGSSFIAAYKTLEERFRRAATPGAWSTEQDCCERQALWNKKRFFAFDSFQGLPKPEATDATSRDFSEGKFACTEQEFRRNLSARGIPLDRVTTVPGWFSETLTEETRTRLNLRHAAIVWVDCDLYESTKPVLEFIAPLLVDGTVIIFDDWFNFKGHPNFGEQRACREWLTSHPDWGMSDYQTEGPWRNSFIVHKR
jgi:O-methyltransferase